MQITTDSGLRLVGHSVGDPSGPPILFLHGGGQTRHTWDAAVESMAARGWHAATVDLRGHGESDWSPDGDYRTATVAADVAAWVTAFNEQPVLVGASKGGLAALHYLAEPAARGRALILVDVVIAIEPDGARHIRDFMQARPDGFASIDEAAEAVAAYGSSRRRPARREGLLSNLRQGDDGRYRWHWDPRLLEGSTSSDVMRQTEDLEHRAARLAVPVLLVRGGRSRIVSDRGVEHLLGVLPHAEIATVHGAGHMVAGDENDAFHRSHPGLSSSPSPAPTS
ncbi:alpha/beta hydrolase [Rhodococcus sp. T2V]|nr:alpha/beta hydrolase [Rhodococcus sp. T2V]